MQSLYDKDVKGYVCLLEGSPATTKMQLPKDLKQSCEYLDVLSSRLKNKNNPS